MRQREHPTRTAFTIVEILATIAVASIIAASVIPTTSRMADARRAAGVYDTARLLEFARAHAAASGMPTGVDFDLTLDTATLIRFDGTVIIESDPMDDMPDPTPLAGLFGCDVTGIEISPAPDAAQPHDPYVIWFDYRSVPHLRSENASSRIELDDDATVVFADGRSVVISQRSGMVEVNP